MALTWTDNELKMITLAKTSDAAAIVQLRQDWQTGYHMFNALLARYYSRKQQFADIVSAQSIYQVPIDSVRMLTISVLVTTTFEMPLVRITSEEKWRQLTSVKTVTSNWPTHYFPLGNDQIAIWPTPSTAVTKGLRFVYQPQDHDLTIEDVTSTTTSQTVTVTQSGVTVTASGTAFTTDYVGLYFQGTGITDTTFYEIVGATPTTLTLKTPYVAASGSGKAWRVGQLPITPQEYHEAPCHYALGMYWSAQGNESRAAFHLGNEKTPGIFYKMVVDCRANYSSANESAVYTEDNNANSGDWWHLNPTAV